ncbi:MAG: Uma2 family endonuclease [Actinomycetota bacterium]
MATESSRIHTYQDLLAMPETNRIVELIGGELIMTAAASYRHQKAAFKIARRLDDFCEAYGGEMLDAPFAVYFSDTDVVEPDVIYVRPENLGRIEERRLVGPPDVAVEVSSPSMRQIDVSRKLRLYEANGVPEYWYVNLEADRVEVHRLGDQGYGLPALYGRGDVLESPLLPGLAIAVGEILGPAEE